MYGIDNSGSKYNLAFTAENDWIADVDSSLNKLVLESKKPGCFTATGF